MKGLTSIPSHLRVFFVFAIFFGSILLVHAQSPFENDLGSGGGAPPVNNPGIVNDTIDGAIMAFNRVIKLSNDAINSISGNSSLRSYGKRLALTLTSIVIIWSIIKNIALKQSLSQLIGDLVFPLVIAAFVLTAGIDLLPSVIKSSTEAVAGLFGAGSSAGMEGSLASSMFKAIGDVWNAKSNVGTLDFLTAPVSVVALLILRIGVIFLMLLATALGVAAILVAKFQIALAVGLAGLFIPWILFKPTEFLFSGWLNFFLKAGFGLVGIFAVSSVVLAGAKGMTDMITNVNADATGVLTFVGMAAMSVLFAYLMLKGSDIGEGLIGGGATGIGQLTSVAKGGAAMVAPRMAAATAGAAGSVAKTGAARVAGKMVGANDMGRGGSALTDAAFRKGSFTRAAFDAARGNKPNRPGKPGD